MEKAAEGVECFAILFDREVKVGKGFEFASGDGSRGFAMQTRGDERVCRVGVPLERHFDDFRGASSIGHSDYPAELSGRGGSTGPSWKSEGKGIGGTRSEERTGCQLERACQEVEGPGSIVFAAHELEAQSMLRPEESDRDSARTTRESLESCCSA